MCVSECVRVCLSVCAYVLDIDRLTTLRVSVSARGFVLQAVHSGVYVYASYAYASVLFASTDTSCNPHLAGMSRCLRSYLVLSCSAI